MKLKRRGVGMIQSSSMSRAAPPTNGDQKERNSNGGRAGGDSDHMRQRHSSTQSPLDRDAVVPVELSIAPSYRARRASKNTDGSSKLPAGHGFQWSYVQEEGGRDAVVMQSRRSRLSAVQWVSGFALRGPMESLVFAARPALKKRSHDPFDPAATSQIFGRVKPPVDLAGAGGKSLHPSQSPHRAPRPRP